MAKRLTQEEKKEITQFFNDGISIDKLSEKFNCTKLTISRNLKQILGNEEYKRISKGFSLKKNNKRKVISSKQSKDNISNDPFFVEIAPLNTNFYNEKQKELSSIPLESVIFPKLFIWWLIKKLNWRLNFLKISLNGNFFRRLI